MDTHNMCLEELKARDLKRKEDDWCFERYNCPRFTTPDENGNVISNINGINKSIEEYGIGKNSYDFIMAVSALEHIENFCEGAGI